MSRSGVGVRRSRAPRCSGRRRRGPRASRRHPAWGCTATDTAARLGLCRGQGTGLQWIRACRGRRARPRLVSRSIWRTRGVGRPAAAQGRQAVPARRRGRATVLSRTTAAWRRRRRRQWWRWQGLGRTLPGSRVLALVGGVLLLGLRQFRGGAAGPRRRPCLPSRRALSRGVQRLWRLRRPGVHPPSRGR